MNEHGKLIGPVLLLLKGWNLLRLLSRRFSIKLKLRNQPGASPYLELITDYILYRSGIKSFRQKSDEIGPSDRWHSKILHLCDMVNGRLATCVA